MPLENAFRTYGTALKRATVPSKKTEFCPRYGTSVMPDFRIVGSGYKCRMGYTDEDADKADAVDKIMERRRSGTQ